MRLNRAELAQALRVSLNTINAWVIRGCPMESAGGRGVASVFNWNAVERWAFMYKTWPNYGDPERVIGAAYHRAKAIVTERSKKKRKSRR